MANPQNHGTTGTKSRDGHTLGSPQSSDAVHSVKSEMTSHVEAPPKPHNQTGAGKGGGC